MLFWEKSYWLSNNLKYLFKIQNIIHWIMIILLTFNKTYFFIKLNSYL